MDNTQLIISIGLVLMITCGVESRLSALFTYEYTEPPMPPMRNCPCSSNPCDNMGKCVNELNNSYRCECQGNWRGETCDDCLLPSMLVCKNDCIYKLNGLCNDGGIGAATSHCAAGMDCFNCGARCL